MPKDRRKFIKESAAFAAGTMLAASRLSANTGDHDMIIKNVKALINGEFVKCDIGISGSKITQIDKTCALQGTRGILDAKGIFASPGWVDLHTHAISVSNKKIGTPIERLGEATGVTALVDVGTCGPANYDMLKTQAISKSPIEVYGLMNIKKHGIRVRDIYRVKPGWEDFDLMERTLSDNPDTIKGIKIRASAEDTVKKDPLYYMRKCREAGDRFGIPTMVHIGPPEPNLSTLLPLMKEGDILTHAMRKLSHSIVLNGKIRDEVKDALKRGITFDVAHGMGSFAFDTAEIALDQGFDDFTISTDLWVIPTNLYARTMANVMTKFLAIGLSLEDVCYKSSTRAGQVIGIEREIAVGKPASITLFSLQDGDFELVDTVKGKRRSSKRIIPEWTIHNGKKFRAGEFDRKIFL